MKKKVLLSVLVFLLVFTGFALANKVFAAGEEKTGKFVHWKGGSTWSYYTVGDFEVNSLTIDDINLDGRRVYCCEHEKRTPQDTTSTEYPNLTAKIYYPDTPGYDARVATILYYGPGGEGQRWPLNDESLVATSMALDFCFTGDRRASSTIGRNEIYLELLRLAEEEPLNDISYVLFRPEYDNFQITAAYVGIANPTGTVVVEKKDSHGKLKAGSEFRLYNDKDSFTGTTGQDGKIRFEEVPVGEYTLEETKAPNGMINDVDIKTTTITVTKDNTTTYSKTNTYPKAGADLSKVNKDGRTMILGDSTLAGAEFELKAAEDIYEGETKIYSKDDVVKTFVTDEEGKVGEVTDLPLGKYYLVETKASEGYMLNETRYDVEFSYVDENTPYVGKHTFEIPEDAIYGKIEVFKFENIAGNVEKSPAEGAVLRLTLQGDETEYYEATVDEYGYAEFINQEVKDLGYDHTIPYGTYTLEEVAGPEGEKYYFIQPVTITINEQDQEIYKIVSDNPVPVWLRVIKKNLVTGETVPLAGAEFEIYTTAGEKVSMRVATSGAEISTFVTNSDGEFFTPRELYPGEYVIYETKAPKGFYLQDEWRKPANSEDFGNPEKGGKYIKIDKLSAGLEGDAVYPLEGVSAGEIVYETNMPDKPLYVNLLIEKTAERLTEASQSTVSYVGARGENVEIEQMNPIYTENIGLKDVEYKIYANEDIYEPTGELFASKDEEVDHITTDENGQAQSRLDLFPGEYRVEEYKVPAGYLLDTTPTIVKLENEDQLVESKTTKLELKDIRQKLGLKFEKEFKESKYTTGDETKYAVFGIFTKEAINNYKDQEVIPSDTLVELMVVEENGMVESTVDLPEGEYEVKELYAQFPYAQNTQTQLFSLKYNNDGVTPKIVVEGQKVVNDEEFGKMHFIKLSTTVNNKLVMNGRNVSTEGLDEIANDLIEELKNKTDAEVEAYFEEHPMLTVSGAKYEVWLDEKGEKKVYETLDNGQKQVAVFETNGYGAIDIKDFPIGKFYLKEVEAPAGYEVSEELIPFELTKSNDEASIYEAIFDNSSHSHFLHKTDIFTGKDVPNCLFEITDADGNVILRATTDEEGLAWIPNDAFIPYKDIENPVFYYTEIEAPEVYYKDGQLYELNTEPHEFTGTFDEKGFFNAEVTEVENVRPVTNVKFVKTDEEDNLVPNCKFELKSEEEGLYYETGVTDENGIYVFENVPQGWYTYTELEAPEEYNVDTTPHRVYVTGDEMVVDFVNTGDIPVVALAILGVVCVAGIAYVVIRKVKANKKA